MPDAASLPIAFSQHVRQLSRAGHLTATVTTGHAWGGNREAVTIHSGLLAARHVEKADVILCMLGPGVAGTGTVYGFSGVQLAEVIHAVSALGGTPFLSRASALLTSAAGITESAIIRPQFWGGLPWRRQS